MALPSVRGACLPWFLRGGSMPPTPGVGHGRGGTGGRCESVSGSLVVAEGFHRVEFKVLDWGSTVGMIVGSVHASRGPHTQSQVVPLHTVHRGG